MKGNLFVLGMILVISLTRADDQWNHHRVRRQKYAMEHVSAGQINNFKPSEIEVTGTMHADKVNNVGEGGLLKGLMGTLKNGIFGNGPENSTTSDPPKVRRDTYPIDKINAGIVNNMRTRRGAPKYQMGNVNSDTINNY